METALLTLAQSTRLTAAEEAAIAAELAGAVEAESVLDVALAADAGVECAEVDTDAPPATIVLRPADVVWPSRTSRSTLVFGDRNQIGRAKSRRPSKQTKHSETPMIADLFAPDVAVPQQLALF